MSTGGGDGKGKLPVTTVPTLALELLSASTRQSHDINTQIIESYKSQVKRLKDIIARQGEALHGFQYRKPPTWGEVEHLIMESNIHGEFSDTPEEVL